MIRNWLTIAALVAIAVPAIPRPALDDAPRIIEQEIVIEEAKEIPLLAIDTAGNLIVLTEIEGFVWEPDELEWPATQFSARCRGSIHIAAGMKAKGLLCLKTDELARWAGLK